MCISSNDLILAGPAVADELRIMVRFSRAFFWVPDDGTDCFSRCDLSRRQRERAEAAFAAGRPFWDVVSSCAVIPVGRGAFILSGLDRSVGPEESDRWLPLLRAWIEKAIIEQRDKTRNITVRGEVPPYLASAARHAINRGKTLMALHMACRGKKIFDPASPDSPLHILETVLHKIGGRQAEHMRIELAGRGPQDIWVTISNISHSLLSRGLEGLEHWHSARSTGISRAIIHVFDNTADNDIEGNILSIEKTADLLGMPLFSKAAMQTIEERFSCTGAGDLLASIPDMSGSRQVIAAFAGNLSPDSMKQYENMNDHDGYHISPQGQCALFLKKVPLKDRNDFDTVSWGMEIQKTLNRIGTENIRPAPVGVAAAWQETLRSKDVPGAAFWAFIHASMLGKRGVVIHDAVTWQLRGDELLAAGAVRHACRAFRQALKLDAKSTDIWNSLGVGLAGLGRNREAERAFRTAAHHDPSDFMAFYNLCGILHAGKEYKDAEMACRNALAIHSGDPRALLRLTRILLDMERNREALGCMEKIPEHKIDTVPGACRMLGTALYRNGQWGQAKRALQQALKSRPDDPLAMALLAHGYASHEDDLGTARKIMDNITGKGAEQPEVSRLLEEINCISAQSSLDKEKGDG